MPCSYLIVRIPSSWPGLQVDAEYEVSAKAAGAARTASEAAADFDTRYRIKSRTRNFYKDFKRRLPLRMRAMNDFLNTPMGAVTFLFLFLVSGGAAATSSACSTPNQNQLGGGFRYRASPSLPHLHTVPWQASPLTGPRHLLPALACPACSVHRRLLGHPARPLLLHVALPAAGPPRNVRAHATPAVPAVHLLSVQRAPLPPARLPCPSCLPPIRPSSPSALPRGLPTACAPSAPPLLLLQQLPERQGGS